MKYDLHIHTHFSRCSNMVPRELLRVAKSRGLNGIAVTDHNTIQGGLSARNINDDPNFEVIVGAEIKTPHGEILGYYLNEEIKSRDFFDVIDEIHDQGGLAVTAHPTALFRSSLKHPCIEIDRRIDGFEVFNSRAFFFELDKAYNIADKFNFCKTGGSDAHFYYEVGRGYTNFNGSLRNALRKGETEVGGSILYAPVGGLLSFMRKFVYK